MESEWGAHPPPAGPLVRDGDDDVVCRSRDPPSIAGMLTRSVQCSHSGVGVRPRGPCRYRTRESFVP